MAWPITIAAGTTIPASWYPAVSNGMQHWQGQVDANGQNLVNVATLSSSNLLLSGAVALKFTGSDFKYTECESAHLAFNKKRGSYSYYWRVTDDGLRAGANNFQAMELTDIGDLNIGGQLMESAGLGSYNGRRVPYGDLNNASVNGFWDVDATTLNKPSGCSTYGSAITANHASNTRAQLCMSAQPGATNAMWIRHSASWGDTITWEPWSQFAIQGQDVTFTKVGIGTTSPSTLLALKKNADGSIGPTITLQNDGGGAGTGSSIDFVAAQFPQSVGSRISAIDDGNYSQNLIFSTKTPGPVGAGSLVERMRIMSSGNVGIGTTNPAAKFVVAGGNPGNLFSADPDTNTFSFVSSGGQNTSFDALRNALFAKSTGALASLLQFFGEAPYGYLPAATGGAIVLNGTSNSNDGSVRIYSSAGGAPVERITVLNNGNVGIGTTNATNLLTLLYNDPNAMKIVGNSSNSVGLTIENTVAGGASWSLCSSGGQVAPAGSLLFYQNGVGVGPVIANSGNLGLAGVTDPKASIHTIGRVIQGLPATQPTDPELSNNTMNMWISGNTLLFRVRCGDGVIRQGSIALIA